MLPGTFEEWLDREWLLTNGRGGFASSTLIDCPTRREHGWMIVNLPGPRPERWMLWSHAAENLQVDGRTFLLANFEFNSAVDPHGYRHLTAVEILPDGPEPSVTWHYKLESAVVRRRVSLLEGDDVLIVQYHVEGKPHADLRLQVWPLIAARPLGSLRRKSAGELFQMQHNAGTIALRYRIDPRISFGVVGRRIGEGPGADFLVRGDWWYNFRYRREAERGLDFGEDLMVPGMFTVHGKGTVSVELIAVAGAGELRDLSARLQEIDARRSTAPRPAEALISIRAVDAPPDRDGAALAAGTVVTAPLEEVLSRAARQFVIRQPTPSGSGRMGVIAGYPWLEEYSRDACVSLPGLLLAPGRHAEARELLLRIALLRRDGALPSHLGDDPAAHDFINADSALWFIYAVDAYLTASGDAGGTTAELLRASIDIVRSLVGENRRGMRMAEDGLLVCEDVSAAATWMDARYAWVFTTPRCGKPVEVNALWYHALSVLAARLGSLDPSETEECARLAARVGSGFAAAFYNARNGGLYDVIGEGGPDASVRPNQLLAVSLPNSPLSTAQQESVLRLVQERLLTPFGLRTLAPDDPNYRGRYEGDMEQRERAAHQGSVYAWWFGPYVDAYLRVHGRSAKAKAAARELLHPILQHLIGPSGLGGISELFDGDPPHTPRGCIDQAWCVAEVARAWALTEVDAESSRRPARGGLPAETERLAAPPARRSR